MADQTPQQPKDVNETTKPVAAPTDGTTPTASDGKVHAGGKPPLAPIFEAPKPKPKPAETAQPPPESGD